LGKFFFATILTIFSFKKKIELFTKYNTKYKIVTTMSHSIAPMNPEELINFMSAFKTSVIHFPSVIVYENGNIYKGETSPMGHKNGLGEIYYTNGAVFAARWVNNISFGTGVYFSNLGTVYRGSWINDIFHGKNNSITFQNGDIYSGNICNNAITGQGTMTYKKQEMTYSGQEQGIYTGQFVNGQKTGYGIHVWLNGNIYRGGWNNDLFDGEGILDANNTHDAIYTGPWINGQQQPDGQIIPKC
jgi:hypothetical protein